MGKTFDRLSHAVNIRYSKRTPTLCADYMPAIVEPNERTDVFREFVRYYCRLTVNTRMG